MIVMTDIPGDMLGMKDEWVSIVPPYQVGDAQRVGESRVRGAGEDTVGDSQLAKAVEALELRRVAHQLAARVDAARWVTVCG
jgi:hypothetical protein